MITVKEINTLDEVMDLISNQDQMENIDRFRSLKVYRGMSNSNFKLVTSLQRNCKNKKSLEKSILNNFTKYAAIDDPSITESVWRQVILGQHHGLPTRLLDWTNSPLVALHFAVTEPDLDAMNSHDCIIWELDMPELKELLPQKYKDRLNENGNSMFSVNQLMDVTADLETYDAEMGNKSMVIVEPPSIDPRIVNQFSFFTIIPNQIDDIEDFLDKNTNNTVKYIISKDLRWRIRDMLDQLNITERIIYPGLDGLSAWLGRHYYVKDNNN